MRPRASLYVFMTTAMMEVTAVMAMTDGRTDPPLYTPLKKLRNLYSYLTRENYRGRTFDLWELPGSNVEKRRGAATHANFLVMLGQGIVEDRKYHFPHSFTLSYLIPRRQKKTEERRKKIKNWSSTCRATKPTWKKNHGRIHGAKGKKMLKVGVRHTRAREKERWKAVKGKRKISSEHPLPQVVNVSIDKVIE